ncbi:four helix bundle protein [Candidatus Saccharibacteria bacterium]|nr:four helix bundle protein [Candidatus Saccharibacteria bacterium]
MANKINSFEDLEAWQEAHTFAVAIYKATNNFPANEQFGLTSQHRRAAVSISSNIAEGFSRHSIKEKIQFYSVAKGSVVESQSQLLLARDVGYLDIDKYESLANRAVRVHKLVNGLTSSVKSWSQPNTKYEQPIALSNSEKL